MASVFQKAVLSWRMAGRVRTLQRALQRVVPPWLFDANSLLAVETDFADLQFPPVSGDWPHRWADESDFELLTQGGLTATEVRRFLDADGRAAICVKDGKLIASTWFIPKNWICFDWIRGCHERRVFGTAAYVAPEYRGQRVRSETRHFAYPALSSPEYVGMFSFVERANRSTLRGGSRTPRRYVGQLSYARLLGLVVYRLDGKWGAGFWNRSRPLDVRFEDFDREAFHTAHKHAISSLDAG